MRCVICRNAETHPGFVTITLEREGLTFVVKRVPAQVCPNCGEEYLEEDVSTELLARAEEIAKEGAQVDIREYIAK